MEGEREAEWSATPRGRKEEPLQADCVTRSHHWAWNNPDAIVVTVGLGQGHEPGNRSAGTGVWSGAGSLWFLFWIFMVSPSRVHTAFFSTWTQAVTFWPVWRSCGLPTMWVQNEGAFFLCLLKCKNTFILSQNMIHLFLLWWFWIFSDVDCL